MRQSQQNKRARGRGRKPSGNSNRVFESNGPDVKIRGTASHVADKYVSLSRDAHSSGDRVAAENYLQHAEHYFRIIALAQENSTSQPNMSALHNGSAEKHVEAGDSSATVNQDGDGRNGQSPPLESEDGAVSDVDDATESQLAGAAPRGKANGGKRVSATDTATQRARRAPRRQREGRGRRTQASPETEKTPAADKAPSGEKSGEVSRNAAEDGGNRGSDDKKRGGGSRAVRRPARNRKVAVTENEDADGEKSANI